MIFRLRCNGRKISYCANFGRWGVKIQFCESVLEMFDKYSRYFTYATLAFETLV